jgi:aspartate/methionine/tyrosine aminotransferase
LRFAHLLQFTPLARESKAINLGQGFPDWPARDFIKQAMVNAVTADANQYTRSAGHPPLVQKLAKIYETSLSRPINWETQIAVGVGATETLYSVMQSLVNEGDEVVLISPAFDIYAAQVQMAGGIPVYVPLRLKRDSGSSDTQCKYRVGLFAIRF